MRETTGKTYYELEQQGYTHDGIAQLYRIKPASVARQINLYKQALQNEATSVAAQVASPVHLSPRKTAPAEKLQEKPTRLGAVSNPSPKANPPTPDAPPIRLI